MSDSSQGPGWWQASDGKWYPPEQATVQPPATFGGQIPAPPAGQAESFFHRLFDMSFTRFITPSIIKLLFVLSIVVISLIALFMLLGGLAALGSDDGAAGGLVLIIFAPVYWLLGVIWSRVILELIVVFFRIETNTRD